MSTLLIIYVINASLLLLHEIESAFAKEWEILKLPGKISGFLFLHIPIILVLFWGAVEIDRQSLSGLVIAIIAGVGGLIPFVVHKIIVKKKGYFDLTISNCIIYLNIFTGLATVTLSVNALIN
jgi:hypothetical protein